MISLENRTNMGSGWKICVLAIVGRLGYVGRIKRDTSWKLVGKIKEL